MNTVKKKKVTKRSVQLFLLSIPCIVLVIAFSYGPLLGWGYAFVRYRLGASITDMKFVGLDNFKRILTEWPEISRVLRNTLVMSFLSLATSILPVFFAIMMNEITNKHVRNFVQTVTTLPNFISWIVVYGIVFALFSNSGGVTILLKQMGINLGPTGILGNVNLTWGFQLLLQIWKGIGWGAIIYLAAISGIDESLYEAAEIDGANKFQRICHITFPGVLPTYFVMLLISIGNILSNGFDQFFVFYNSLVSERIEVLDYYVYKIGLVSGDFSYSIVVGMLKSLVSIALLFVANTVAKKVRGEGII